MLDYLHVLKLDPVTEKFYMPFYYAFTDINHQNCQQNHIIIRNASSVTFCNYNFTGSIVLHFFRDCVHNILFLLKC